MYNALLFVVVLGAIPSQQRIELHSASLEAPNTILQTDGHSGGVAPATVIPAPRKLTSQASLLGKLQANLWSPCSCTYMTGAFHPTIKTSEFKCYTEQCLKKQGLWCLLKMPPTST